MHNEPLRTVDPELWNLILAEEKRQADKIRLIPSENYASAAVLEATGSVLTNKYSEGYPGRRYYEGQQIIDQVEILARDRAKRCGPAARVFLEHGRGRIRTALRVVSR